MKLISKDPRVDTSNFTITKDGKLLRDNKELSKAYGKKYASDLITNYRFVTNKHNKETIRDKKGRFVTKEIASQVRELKIISEKRTTRKIAKDKQAPYGKKLKGSFMKATYAITCLCTCEVISKGYAGQDKGELLKHYYTVSSNKRLSYASLAHSHNSDYPLHELIDMSVTSTKEVSFE